MKKVKVTFFPKKCPHCDKPMKDVRKLSGSWLECKNVKCPYFTSQKPKVRTVRGIKIEEDPMPFTSNYSSR